MTSQGSKRLPACAIMLRLIRALMVLIAAFVALKTIDLLLPPERLMMTVEKKGANATGTEHPAPAL